MENTFNDGRRFDEFSPKKLILQLQRITRLVLRKWLWIVLAGICIAGAAWLYYSIKSKTEYVAEMTFAVDEEISKQKRSGLSEITEQLGLGPSDGGLLYNSESNIAAMMMSRFMIENTLRKRVPQKKADYTYADFFLDSLKFRKKWMKGSPFAATKFSSAPNDPAEQLFQNAIITQIKNTLTEKCIKINKKLSGSNIISISCITEHELFSKMFLEELVLNVTEQYVNARTLRAKSNMNVIDKRIDSVNRAYVAAMYGKAGSDDANINLVKQRAIVAGNKKQTEVDVLRSTYIELALSLEAAKTTLLQNTPVIQILDAPVLPLKINSTNVLRKVVIFFLIGSVVAAILVVLSVIYKLIMSNEK